VVITKNLPKIGLNLACFAYDRINGHNLGKLLRGFVKSIRA
jgi:hypothetical protein